LSLIRIWPGCEADEPLLLFTSFPVNADRIFLDSNGSTVRAARPSRGNINLTSNSPHARVHLLATLACCPITPPDPPFSCNHAHTAHGQSRELRWPMRHIHTRTAIAHRIPGGPTISTILSRRPVWADLTRHVLFLKRVCFSTGCEPHPNDFSKSCWG
jgi:hypothetical protein